MRLFFKFFTLFVFGWLLTACSQKPTEEQTRYFRNSAANTEYIRISSHADSGDSLDLRIESFEDVFKFRMEIELDRIHPAGRQVGEYDITFVSSSGHEFMVNYSLEENRIRFQNPWDIEGTPYSSFPILLKKHLEAYEKGKSQD